MNENEQALITQIVGSCGLSSSERRLAIRNFLVDAATGAAVTDGPLSERFRVYQYAITEIDGIVSETGNSPVRTDVDSKPHVEWRGY